MGNYNFEYDLPAGVAGERLVQELLAGERGTIEVKRDFKVTETGNIAIEFECRGHKSDIAVTKATWWALVLDGKKFAHEIIIFIKTTRLKEIARSIYKENGWVIGGDKGSNTKMVLIPIEEFIRYNPEFSKPELI